MKLTRVSSVKYCAFRGERNKANDFGINAFHCQKSFLMLPFLELCHAVVALPINIKCV